MAEEKSKKNVNVWRRCKRKLRTRIDWNNWQLSHQMATHIATQMVVFVIIYCLFITIITSFYYRNDVLVQIEPEQASNNRAYFQLATTNTATCIQAHHTHAHEFASQLKEI